MSSKKKICYNPFNKLAHSSTVSDLRPFPTQDLWKVKGADEKSLLCSSCRKDVRNYTPTDSQSQSESQTSESQTPSENPSTSEENFDTIHPIHELLGVSPVKRKYSDRNLYMGEKLNEMQEMVRKKFKAEFKVSPKTEADQIVEDYKIIIENIKKAAVNESGRSLKLLISLLPSEWPVSRIANDFNVSRKLVESAKSLKEISIPSACDDKTEKAGRKKLNLEIKERIIQFYENEENSKQLPGKKDVKSIVQVDGTRKLIPKKLVLCNLSELYSRYQEKYPFDQISFSKFASLRPKYCVLAGSSGTHTVCVCTIHENVKLMLKGCKFSKLFRNSEWINKAKPTFEDLLRKFICTTPTISCYERSCKFCLSTDHIRHKLIDAFEKEEMHEISYKIWATTDRCTILEAEHDVEDFLEILMKNLEKLLLHDFIASQQNKYFTQVKEELLPGEFAVVLDFAENYAFVAQDAAQAFHWNNDQATLFPIVIYYKQNGKLEHHCLVGISDCLKHDSISVYMFQEKLLGYLKEKYGESVYKIHYFSDGAPQQFKNKKAFVNLCSHFSDFKVQAEWNFFATAHGKGPCDGVAGSTKCLATRASLQRGIERPILTPFQLFEWAEQEVKNIDFFFIGKDVYEEKELFLAERFSKCVTVKGTLGYHSITPMVRVNDSAIVKTFSFCDSYKTVKVMKT